MLLASPHLTIERGANTGAPFHQPTNGGVAPSANELDPATTMAQLLPEHCCSDCSSRSLDCSYDSSYYNSNNNINNVNNSRQSNRSSCCFWCHSSHKLDEDSSSSYCLRLNKQQQRWCYCSSSRVNSSSLNTRCNRHTSNRCRRRCSKVSFPSRTSCNTTSAASQYQDNKNIPVGAASGEEILSSRIRHLTLSNMRAVGRRLGGLVHSASASRVDHLRSVEKIARPPECERRTNDYSAQKGLVFIQALGARTITNINQLSTQWLRQSHPLVWLLTILVVASFLPSLAGKCVYPPPLKFCSKWF